MTTGGLGVAFFWPYTETRYFLPWRPIEVSPFSPRIFFSERGLAVILSELRWVWAPCAAFALSGFFHRAAHFPGPFRHLPATRSPALSTRKKDIGGSHHRALTRRVPHARQQPLIIASYRHSFGHGPFLARQGNRRPPKEKKNSRIWPSTWPWFCPKKRVNSRAFWLKTLPPDCARFLRHSPGRSGRAGLLERDLHAVFLAVVPFFGGNSRGSVRGFQQAARGKKPRWNLFRPSPTGPLHIGHGRGAAIGDSVARIMRFAGYDVTAEYYINDAGQQDCAPWVFPWKSASGKSPAATPPLSRRTITRAVISLISPANFWKNAGNSRHAP